MVIDCKLQDLIRVLNEIPYISTIECCEGHVKEEVSVLYDKKDYLIKSDENKVFIQSGSLIFKTNYECEELLNEVSNLNDKYDFAIYWKDESCHIVLNMFDLTQREKISEKDSVETLTKKMYQVDKDIGFQRKKDFDKYWDELLEISKKY